MYNWYSFEPSDTVFFRGSEPMEKGHDHTANSIFPPPIHTIAGAIRTYFYNIDKKNNEKKYSHIVKIGEEYGEFNLAKKFTCRRHTHGLLINQQFLLKMQNIQ